MTARHDLDNAISILDAGISAHVGALRSARDAAAHAQTAANDDSYVKALTTKVLALADTLNASASDAAPVAPAAPVVAVVEAPPVATGAPAAPVALVISPEFLVVSSAPVAPAVTTVPEAPVELHDPGATPAMIAAWRASHGHQAAVPSSTPTFVPAVGAPAVAAHVPTTMEAMEDAVRKMLGGSPKK